MRNHSLQIVQSINVGCYKKSLQRVHYFGFIIFLPLLNVNTQLRMLLWEERLRNEWVELL
jgi:hypothetical protein